MIRPNWRSQRGSVVPFALVIVVALMIVFGLVVDGGGRIAALQKAESVAREAARQAGQSMSGEAVLGTGVTIDTSAGRAAAQRYLAAAHVDGTVTIRGSTVHVVARVEFTPVVLSIIGIGKTTVTGEADSAPANVYEGQR